jgi:tetratricopeptide (TPR) repeat protein
VATAHTIFQRLVQVAGTRAGVVPRLMIIAREPWDIVLPIALPDGSIVLSKRVLDICYQIPTQGEARLAFVLGHEIAHLLNNDLWHISFFTRKPAMPPEVFPAHVVASELRADEQGILYAAMAGFHTHAVVTLDRHSDFFAEWGRALERVGGVPVHQMRPTPQERAEALRDRLRQVVERTAVFQVGLWFSYAGDYPRSIQAFAHFRTVFPSREVSHNLATSHHHLALHAYQVWKQGAPLLPLQLSLVLDPVTRASRILLEGPRRGGATPPAAPEAQFREHLDAAITLYRAALTQDAAYMPAALNLACALIVHGLSHPATAGLQADFAEAVTILLRAWERIPNAPEAPALLNNLGVALWYAGQTSRAMEYLRSAHTLAPTYAAPAFNLAYIAWDTGQDTDAQVYQRVYEQLVVPSAPAPPPRVEYVEGVAVGHLLPAYWQALTQSSVPLAGKSMTLTTYRHGIMTLSQADEILMFMVGQGYPGTSTYGIKMGNQANEVLARYGVPSRRVELASGQSWAYDAHRIAFQLRDGQVVSWLVF